LDAEVGNQQPWCQMNKKHHRIAADVKADILLRRVNEEGISVAQAAKERGISEGTIYGWMVIHGSAGFHGGGGFRGGAWR
ncbi:MAG TPA: leucine zipper domain-containing protein, partial [Candidatus Acidoferrales bacterium]|nr:leucine zipper domain-containing protein [Candidatus Acidoferrales bacterium]